MQKVASPSTLTSVHPAGNVGPAGTVVVVAGVAAGAVVGAGVTGAWVGAAVTGSHTQPQAPDFTCLHDEFAGATHALFQLSQLFELVTHLSTATSPVVGQRLPTGAAPQPEQMGPLMQKMASPSTLTLVQPGVGALVGGGVGLLVVGAGALVDGPGVTGVLVVGPGVTGVLVVGVGVTGVFVEGAGVGAGRSHTHPHALDVTFLHDDVTGATHALKPLLKLFALVEHCATATSPTVGQSVPDGAAFQPAHTGPLMQNVASPSTLTWEQPGIGALVVGPGVGPVVVGAFVVGVGVTGAVVAGTGVTGAGVTGDGVTGVTVGALVVGVVVGVDVAGVGVTGAAVGALVVGITGAGVTGAGVTGATVGGLGVTAGAGVGVTVWAVAYDGSATATVMTATRTEIFMVVGVASWKLGGEVAGWKASW